MLVDLLLETLVTEDFEPNKYFISNILGPYQRKRIELEPTGKARQEGYFLLYTVHQENNITHTCVSQFFYKFYHDSAQFSFFWSVTYCVIIRNVVEKNQISDMFTHYQSGGMIDTEIN